ncbi:hypothetical protein [Microbacterium murale]|uniref:Vacuolar-type H+-ATPase subunit I/STV1 n=1 Tax=Microbacterium murale TaxID=1081040 RepID=A0ABU0P665_9MICO|nr:hypothetical protein [Microbacterium murale]MDQ0642813.1 vacuolar-type H+-ATPase subunit I/STV1 [Microbacterium murale]
MMARTPELQARRDRTDLWTGIIVGALVIAFVSFRGTSAVVSLFATPGAITVDAHIPAQVITTRLGEGTEATVTSGTLVVADVNTVSVICLVLAIVLGALGLAAAAALGAWSCIRMLRGTVFDQLNVRLLFALSLSLLLAWAGEYWFRNMGLNGVFAAIDEDFRGQTAFNLATVPLLVAAIAVGVLVIVFRRGTALQKDAEGLV